MNMINIIWDWLGDNYNQISLILGGVALISWSNFRNFICKGLKQLWDNFKKMFNWIREKMFNWIREKIIGKENLELLKELEKLKGNKRAIEFLDSLNKEDEYSKVNGGYEALWIFTRLYAKEMDYSKFKEAYEDNRKQGNNNKINELREETFKKLIKNILNN